jgi:hypothetical protein
VRGRVQFTNNDRLFLIQLYRWCPSVLKAVMIVRPETVVRWHRAGLRRYWRWKSRGAGGRPQIPAELRALICRMSVDNRLWGAPHIHGELLKLGFAVAQSIPSASTWPRTNRNGIAYEPSELTKSEIYGELLPLLNSRTVALLDNDRVLSENHIRT